MSKADKIFKKNCSHILENGYNDSDLEVRTKWKDGAEAHTTKIFGLDTTYDLSDEFPILTIRPTVFNLCVKEILWIYQKQSNKIEELGCNIWNQWADENNTIGKAYGYQIESRPYTKHPIKIDPKVYIVDKNLDNVILGDEFLGIASLGDVDSVKNMSKKHKEYLKTIWMSIIHKCYNYESQNYQEQSIMDEDWLVFENFLRGVRYSKQWKLALEDDFKGWFFTRKYYGSNKYSSESAIWWKKSHRDSSDTVDENGKLTRYKISNNQINDVIHSLKYNRGNRRIMTNFFNYQDMDEKALVECAYAMHYTVTNGEILNGMLVQRSNDFVVANNFNVSEYAILMHMLAQVSGLMVGEFKHVIVDAHIYDRHELIAQELLDREEFDTPEFWINPEVKDFYDFTEDDFKLINYKTGKQVKLPVAE